MRAPLLTGSLTSLLAWEMDMSTVASFDINYTRFVDPAGQPVETLPAWTKEPARLIELYRGMVLTRRFDAKAIALQRTGRLGTYASSLGQEAVTVGLAHAMRAEDVLLPSYRETGAQICRGVSLVELLLYWGGDERGSDFAGPRADFPVAVPIASQCLHATGVAYAFKLRREPRVAVCVSGDGSTSNGAFYEAINSAGAWQVPAVFVICNNHWAISMPRSAQTATATLAQKALAAGIPGEQVDGNDAIAVRHQVGRAVERARAGEGPSVVEALTYRMSDHTTADDATRYRDGETVSAEWAKDPIARLRTFLGEAGHWTKADEERLIDGVNREIDTAVEQYLATPPPEPASMFDHLYAELPPALLRQRQAVAAASAGGRHD
jgi:pyruvate dehydrogenase E1 component alpha subunit